MPGYNLSVLNRETHEPCKPNETGYIVMKTPTPPSFMLSLWKRDEAFIEKYFKEFPGYYETGDSGYFDEDGYFYIMSRVDDVINTAGHRLSTGEMEEVLMKNEKQPFSPLKNSFLKKIANTKRLNAHDNKCLTKSIKPRKMAPAKPSFLISEHKPLELR